MLGNKYDYAEDICLETAHTFHKLSGISIVVTDGVNIQFEIGIADKEKVQSVGAEQD